MPSDYYVVIRDPRDHPKDWRINPTVIHESYEDAKKEAVRLAYENVNTKFYVCTIVMGFIAKAHILSEYP